MVPTLVRKNQYDLVAPFPTDYALTFKYFRKEDIHAVLSFDDGVTEDLPLVLDTDFSLTAPGDSGTLTRLTSWAATAVRLTVYREVIKTQETDYRDGENISPDTMEADFDLAVMRDQENAEEVSRVIKAPITDPPGIDLSLPPLNESAGHILARDAEGRIIPVDGPAGVPVTPFAAMLLDDENLLTALKTLGLLPAGAVAVVSAYIRSLLNEEAISTYAKTLIDDTTAAAARATLEVHDDVYENVTGNGALSVRHKYLVQGDYELTLPAAPAVGERIEIISDAWPKILQPNVQTVMNYRDQYFTTKGAGGYLALKPKTRVKLVYQGNGVSPLTQAVKLADPAVLPPAVQHVAMSADGIWLVATANIVPRISIYKRTAGTDTFVRQPDPAYVPSIAMTGVSISADGTKIVISMSDSPYFCSYTRSGDVWTWVSTLVTPPTGAAYGAAISGDGRFAAVAHDVSPYVSAYYWALNQWTKIANPTVLPTGLAYSVALSYDGGILAVGHDTSPFLSVYFRGKDPSSVQDIYTKMANPADLPAAGVVGLAITRDGEYLAAFEDPATGWGTVFKNTGIKYERLSPNEVYVEFAGAIFSSFKDRLFVASLYGNGVLYKRDSDAWRLITTAFPVLPGNSNGVAASRNAFYVAFSHASSPYLTIFKTVEAVTDGWIVEEIDTIQSEDFAEMFK